MFDLHDILQDRAACARYRAERDALAQRMEEVASEIDRTLSGVEGIEDAPAMRWMRGLREALGSMHSPRHDLSGRVESLEAENEELRDMLNNIAFQLRLDVHYYSGDNYDACQLEVLREIESLRTAASPTSRDDAGDVTMSAYDLLPDDERDAIAWVRKHGGLDEVREWEERDQERIICLLRISSAAVGGVSPIELNGRLDEIAGAVERRIMPEGYEWPRFEDGEPVRIGDVVSDVEVRSMVFREDGILLSDCTSVPGWGTWRSYKEPIKRPAPKVLDADSVQIRVGDTVYLLPGDWCDKFPCYGYHGNEELEVFSLHADHVEGGVGCRDTRRPKGTCYPQPSQLTHERPVIAGDGRPLREGETVFNERGDEFIVSNVDHDYGVFSAIREYDGTEGTDLSPIYFTHKRPETDSWGRLEKDANDVIYDIGFHLGDYSPTDFKEPGDSIQDRIIDLVRRAKALAGVSER